MTPGPHRNVDPGNLTVRMSAHTCDAHAGCAPVVATPCVTNPNAGKLVFRRMTAGLDVSGALAAKPTIFGESGKSANACKKFDVTTDAVLRAAREVVRGRPRLLQPNPEGRHSC